jgi:hypothetical protein
VFTFPSLAAYQITEQGLQNGLTMTQIQAAGGGPTQFRITSGTPLATVNYYEFEPYLEDDWKALPNLTVSAGLRFETQGHIRDHADFAPRVGIAWGLGKGKSPKTVLRAGSGIFYDRISYSTIIDTNRLNGVNQQDYIVANPSFFPTIPAIGTLAASLASPTIDQLDSNLRAPYTSQSGIGLEHQLSKAATVSVTYLNTHGVHQLMMRNINAPDPANVDTARPDPSRADLYQYESAGLYNQNQLITNFNIRGSKVSLFGFYTLSYADGNTAGGFPMNQYNVAADYGRTSYDVRHRVFVGGSWNLPRGFQIFPFVVLSSAPPVNIVSGYDLNGDSIYNDRPAFASAQSIAANVYTNRWGSFDAQPGSEDARIPVDYGSGYGQFAANLRFSKTIGFGKEIQGGNFGGGGGGGGGRGRGLGPGGLSSMGTGGGPFGRGGAGTNHRYNLTFSVSARNVFNDVNYAAPIGILGSSYFGHPQRLAGGFMSSAAANRRIDLQVRFSF